MLHTTSTSQGQWKKSTWLPGTRVLPLLVLMAGLCLTFWASHFISQNNAALERGGFVRLCEEATARLRDRLSTCEYVLTGGVGFFAGSERVTRRDWRKYFEALRPEEKLQGFQGVGFTEHIPADRLADHIARVRAEGFPDYTVRPEGQRSEYTAIVYLEPFEGRNLRAFGYDMFSEPVRREAMSRARDQGRAAMSGRVVLVQEVPGSPLQPGFLIYTPVYAAGQPTETVEHRRSALKGYVYSPLRAGDFADALFAGEDLQLRMEIFDGDRIDPEQLLYSASAPESGKPAAQDRQARQQEVRKLEAMGRTWTLRFSSTPAFEASHARQRPVLVSLAVGLTCSLLVTVLTAVFGARNRALRQLARATESLRASEESYRNQFYSNMVAMLLLDPASGRVVDANAAASRFYGYSHARLLEMMIWDLNVLPREKCLQIMASAGMNAGSSLNLQHRLADGSVRDILACRSPIRFGGAELLHVIIIDETEMVRLHEQTERTAKTLSNLLREVNHRVTNNLSSIVGLIVGERLVLDEKESGAGVQVLDRLKQRISGLLEAHRMLVDSRWEPMRLEELAEKIIRAAFSAAPVSQQISLTVEGPPVLISPRQANALALILNELATNTVKYGSHELRPAAASLSISESDDNLLLVYRDTGAGFPADVLGEARSGVGLALIRQLVHETLRGRMEIANSPGAEVRITLSKEEVYRT